MSERKRRIALLLAGLETPDDLTEQEREEHREDLLAFLQTEHDACSTYLIYNNNMGLFFSNEDGWVDPQSATRFSEDERFSIPHLPGVGSEWIESDSPEVTCWEDPDA